MSKSEVSGRSQLCSGLLLRNFFPGVSSWSVIREEGALQAITRFLGFNSSTVANAKLTALTKWGGPFSEVETQYLSRTADLLDVTPYKKTSNIQCLKIIQSPEPLMMPRFCDPEVHVINTPDIQAMRRG